MAIAADRDGIGPKKIPGPGEEVDTAVGSQNLDRVLLNAVM